MRRGRTLSRKRGRDDFPTLVGGVVVGSLSHGKAPVLAVPQGGA